jgi:hypothetical protein
LNAQRFQHVYSSTVQSLERNIPQILPESAYRDYFLWALSPDNPERETWEHLLGIPQFVQLSLALLDGIVDEQKQDQLFNYSIPMNIYLMFEVVSDDLAIGLAQPSPQDGTSSQRRYLLNGFNDSMIKRLKGHPQKAEALLKPFQEVAWSISGFEQSLIPDKHHTIAQMYLQQHMHVSPRDLEFALWPRLVANIETCALLMESVQGYQFAPLMRAGLINRYRAVEALLEDPYMSLTKRVWVSADAILVVPTLAYYVGLIAESVRPAKNFVSLLDNGILAEALYNAAVLVRLLNDVGTPLLEEVSTRVQLNSFLHDQIPANSQTYVTFGDLMLDSSAEFGASATRLRKDIAHGEFNLGFHNLLCLPAEQGVTLFERRLSQLAAMYDQTWQELSVRLEIISEQLGDDASSTLIKRFVDFHANLYRHEYTHSSGDYTVGVF